MPTGNRRPGRSPTATEVLIPRRSERTSTMVPGMTERERLITDMQRLEWLCDAVIGPARSSGRRPPRIGSPAEAPWVPPPYRGDATQKPRGPENLVSRPPETWEAPGGGSVSGVCVDTLILLSMVILPDSEVAVRAPPGRQHLTDAAVGRFSNGRRCSADEIIGPQTGAMAKGGHGNALTQPVGPFRGAGCARPPRSDRRGPGTSPWRPRRHDSRRHAMPTAALAPARTLDAAAIRDDFPLLARSTPDARPLVYLDSAASSQKPAAVIDALDHYYRHLNANVHRGVYRSPKPPRRSTRRRATSSPPSSTPPPPGSASSSATRPRRSTSSPRPGAAAISASGT